jgi:hypothetical protein
MVAVGVALMFVGVLIVLAVILALNAKAAAPGVRVVRDLLIIFMSLEVVIVGAGLTILLVQLARLINLVRNEIEPLVEAVSETINTVRGTALFLSKNVVEPVTSISSVVRGLGKVAGDVDAIRKAAGVVVEVASAASPGGAVSKRYATVVPSDELGEKKINVKSTTKTSIRGRKSTTKSKEA